MSDAETVRRKLAKVEWNDNRTSNAIAILAKDSVIEKMGIREEPVNLRGV